MALKERYIKAYDEINDMLDMLSSEIKAIDTIVDLSETWEFDDILDMAKVQEDKLRDRRATLICARMLIRVGIKKETDMYPVELRETLAK